MIKAPSTIPTTIPTIGTPTTAPTTAPSDTRGLIVGTTKLAAPTGVCAQISGFGRTVRMHNNFAVIGNWDQDCPYYVYQYNQLNNTWNAFARLQSNDGVDLATLNIPHAASADIYDNTIIIGAYYDESAYIFEFNSTSQEWNQTAKLRPNDYIEDGTGHFGQNVAIYGNIAIVGAQYKDTDAGSLKGSAYLFMKYDNINYNYNDSASYNSSNSGWHQVATLTSSDGSGGFGRAVDIGKNRAIVAGTGGAFIFKFEYTNQTFNISEETIFTSCNSYDVAISTTNTSIRAICTTSTASVYIFDYDTSSGNWGQMQQYSNLERTYFAAISNDYFMLGHEQLHEIYTDSGSVDLYKLVDNEYVFVASLLAPSFNSNGFGSAFSIDGDTAMIGRNTVYVIDLANISMDYGMGLKINYNYETNLEIIGIDENNKDISFSVNECDLGSQALMMENDDGWVFNVNEFNGCFDVTFSDCDESVSNDRTDRHGIYQLTVNETVVAHGGYYSVSESYTICTNDRYQLSYCVIPYYCSNINEPYLWSNITTIEVNSYQSVVNSSTTNLLTAEEDTSTIVCAGDHSCSHSTLLVKYAL